MTEMQEMLLPEALRASAERETGVHDYGDTSFEAALAVFTRSLIEDAALSTIGLYATQGHLTKILANRLRVEAWWKEHPALVEQQITRPVFIVGIPRSGTTALSHLLARDSRHRSLLLWEASSSTPPPTAATYRSDPRYLQAVQNEFDLDAINPGFKAIHHDPPDMPSECTNALAHHFASLSFGSMYNVDRYLDWILTADLEAAYRWHKRLLQLLQSNMPGRWVLKTPQHALFLDTIVKVYPDARFIVTHRDPVVCVGSTASLTASLTGTFSEQDRRAWIGERWTDILATMVERTMAFRARHGDDRFIDVSYDQLVSDPLTAVRRIYDALGEDLTSETEHVMRTHLAEHRQHRYGRHSYGLHDFGLDATKLERRFADYTSRSSITREGETRKETP